MAGLWLGVLGLWMAGVVAAALYLVPVSVEGLGELARVIFFHVPTAWVAVIAFAVAAYHSWRYLRDRSADRDHRALAAVELGLLFSVLATVTGALLARVTWGMYWNWDPRQTSILFLLLIYAAYLSLRGVVRDNENQAMLAAVYACAAFVAVPFLVFVIPRMTASLHPQPVVNPAGRIYMERPMLAVLLASLAGFTGLFAWLHSIRWRVARLVAAHSRMLMEHDDPEGGARGSGRAD